MNGSRLGESVSVTAGEEPTERHHLPVITSSAPFNEDFSLHGKWKRRKKNGAKHSNFEGRKIFFSPFRSIMQHVVVMCGIDRAAWLTTWRVEHVQKRSFCSQLSLELFLTDFPPPQVRRPFISSPSRKNCISHIHLK